MQPLVTVRLRSERDVVLARHRAKRIAALMGFACADRSRVATAVSEVARSAVKVGSGAQCRFEADRRTLRIIVTDAGRISQVIRALDEDEARASELRSGLRGARRLMDTLSVESERGIGVVTMCRALESAAADAPPTTELIALLAQAIPDDPVLELHAQNSDLIDALDRLAAQQHALEEVNEKLVVARAIAERQALLRERTLAVVSHDIRSPLGAVDAALAIIERLSADEPTIAKRAALGRRAADRMSRLITDLFDLATIEAGGFSVNPETTQLRSALSDVLSAKEAEASRDSISLVAVLECDPTVVADPARVVQVIDNLITNALKFTQPNGRVELRTRRDAGFLAIDVSDTGPGIAADDLEHVFDAFYQTRADRRGAGLGLAICRGIALAHGGRMSVASVKGEGTTMTLMLPLRPPPKLIENANKDEE